MISPRRSGTTVVSTAEKKILIVMCYFGLFGIALLMQLSFKVADIENLSNAIDIYIVCELQGLPNECNRRSIERYRHVEVDLFLGVMLASIPVTQLLYIINYKQIKEMIAAVICKKQTETELIPM